MAPFRLGLVGAGLGGTTIADLGCHLIDMALSMAGPVESTCAQAVTFAGRGERSDRRR